MIEAHHTVRTPEHQARIDAQLTPQAKGGPYSAERVLSALRYWIEDHKREISPDYWHQCDIEMPLDVALEVERVLSALMEGRER